MTGSTVSDPAKALAGYLAANLGDLLDKNVNGQPAVFRPDLPRREDPTMPKAALVLRPVGGPTMVTGPQIPLANRRIDITCYGTTAQQANNLGNAVIVALKPLVMQRWEDVMIYSALPTAGPIPLLDTEVLWPAVVVTAGVVHRTQTETL